MPSDEFQQWIDLFEGWQKDIGFPQDLIDEVLKDQVAFQFKHKFGELSSDQIDFGDYKGSAKWKTTMQVPDQRIRDALLHLIVYQGDTEFASVEQQRNLVKSAPSDYDLLCLTRVMAEEMRHGWQMCYLMIEHFGKSGWIEARKQLERRSFNNERLLGSFNVDVDHWLDFFTFTMFIDRDGKFQLEMLSHSGFAPLARSMGPMLKEEAFHLGSGHTGLKRLLKANKIPIDVIQKYFNKWVPTAFDLFGKDQSSSAEWAYVWGIKGRVDEDTNQTLPDKQNLNDVARNLYRDEVVRLTENLNENIQNGGKKLFIPDIRFNRAIGNFADQPYDVNGNLLSEAKFEEYKTQVFPSQEDQKLLDEIFKENDWIDPRWIKPRKKPIVS